MAPEVSSPSHSFAKILSSYHEQYGEPGPSSLRLDTPLRYDVVLDEQGGLITSLMGSLEETIRAKMPSTDWEDSDDMTMEEKEALLREHRTWQLIRTVLDNRLHRADPLFVAPSAQEQVAQSPYISPEDLTQVMVNEDDDLSLYATLVDHLQSRPLLNTPPPLEARHGYLPSTLHRAKAARLKNGSAPLTPPSLDPDFTLRDPHGQGLAGEDQTYQNPLLETLWDLIRHGELDQAVKVCEEGGEPWRGASLMGGRRWTMGGMTRDSPAGPLEGNRTRTLWKKSCRAIAKNPTLSAPERHLYAALISDLPTLLPACESWEDHLWAHVQSRMESALETRWHELGGFWEEEDKLLGKDDGSDGARGGLDEVFANIAQSGSSEARMGATDPYLVAQKMIIQGRTETLLNQFVDLVPRMEESMSPQLIGPLIRFFAHLVLVLRSLQQPVPDTAANLILQAYLTILERDGNDNLVAMYAACLREGNGEESYARFLRAMDPSASKEARKEALSRAKQHNLDVAIIAKETVRLILGDVFATIPALSGDQPGIDVFSTGLSETEVLLIRSIEWLTILPETAGEALIQSNAVARYFLALGRAAAASALLKTLPQGIASAGAFGEDENEHVLEFEHYQALFKVFACHDLVEDVLARAPKHTATKMEQHTWTKNLISAIDRTEHSTTDLLIGDWLRFDIPSSPTASSRRAELRRIRQIFIPDLIFRLHTLLTSQSTQSGQLLQRALDLGKIVADEDNHCYEEFFGRGSDPYRLIAYLDRLRETALQALKSGSENPFVVKV